MARKISIANNLTNTTKVTAYTVPVKNSALWQLLYIVNTDGNNNVNVWWYDSSANTEFYILGGKNMVSGDYIKFDGSDVVLQENDEIRYQLGSSGAVTFISTLELVPNQATQFHGG